MSYKARRTIVRENALGKNAVPASMSCHGFGSRRQRCVYPSLWPNVVGNRGLFYVLFIAMPVCVRYGVDVVPGKRQTEDLDDEARAAFTKLRIFFSATGSVAVD